MMRASGRVLHGEQFLFRAGGIEMRWKLLHSPSLLGIVLFSNCAVE